MFGVGAAVIAAGATSVGSADAIGGATCFTLPSPTGKSPGKNSATHLEFEPIDIIGRLASVVSGLGPGEAAAARVAAAAASHPTSGTGMAGSLAAGPVEVAVADSPLNATETDAWATGRRCQWPRSSCVVVATKK